MWQVSRRATLVAAAIVACVAGSGAQAQQNTNIVNQDVTGFNLPGVQLPQGHDEVRAADGTTCRSAVAGSGAYLDAGVIGNPNSTGGSKGLAAYGRVVIPLGKKAGRLDCGRLYDLEVKRLQMELRLMQMGLGRQGRQTDERTASIDSVDGAQESADGETPPPNKAEEADWADEGWSTEGRE